MGADEEGTLARLTAHRREASTRPSRRHRGRIVKTTGDGGVGGCPAFLPPPYAALPIGLILASSPANRGFALTES